MSVDITIRQIVQLWALFENALRGERLCIRPGSPPHEVEVYGYMITNGTGREDRYRAADALAELAELFESVRDAAVLIEGVHPREWCAGGNVVVHCARVTVTPKRPVTSAKTVADSAKAPADLTTGRGTSSDALYPDVAKVIENAIVEAYEIGHVHGGNATRTRPNESPHRVADGWGPVFDRAVREVSSKLPKSYFGVDLLFSAARDVIKHAAPRNSTPHAGALMDALYRLAVLVGPRAADETRR